MLGMRCTPQGHVTMIILHNVVLVQRSAFAAFNLNLVIVTKSQKLTKSIFSFS